MLISHKHKFIYLKTIKTASTSVEAYFERFCMPEGDWEPSHSRESYESETGVIGYRGRKSSSKNRWYNHMPAHRVKQQLGDEKWNDYYKFCIVRNPWDKALSAYFHFGKTFTNKLRIRIFQKIRYPSYTAKQCDFLAWLVCRQPPIDRKIYQIDDQTVVDAFIRYENLQDDTAKICEKIGVPWDPSLLPRFKSGKRDLSVTPEELYSPAADKIIRKCYTFEIDEFGYTCPFKI